ncbi:MAG: NifU family protein [Pseudomonadota bacterium]
MFIQTETTADLASVKFLPGRPVLPSGTADFADPEAAARSPLAQRLFEIDGVVGVFLDPQSITVRKRGDSDWHVLKPAILGAIMQHFVAGRPVVVEPVPEETDEVAAEIKELIDTRIRPAAAQDGGAVIFRGFKNGIVLVEMQGSGFALMAGIERMLRHYVPEVRGVQDYRDAMPKPGLDTPEAVAVREILEQRINPGVAAHGGHIALVDVKDDTVYIRLEGGCQGCGMADVTLKQGIEREILRAVPKIVAVMDVSDHAGGKNPYYQPGKGGVSPLQQ